MSLQNSGTKYRWVKTVARNEPLDTTVYSLFCSDMLDHYKMTDAQWRRLENDLLPDLFDPIQDMPPPSAPATQAAQTAQPLAIGQIETRDPVAPDAETEQKAPQTIAEPSSSAIEIKAPAAPATPAAPLHPLQQRRAQVARAPARAAPLASPFAKPDWNART